jgi:cation transport ATPase
LRTSPAKPSGRGKYVQNFSISLIGPAAAAHEGSTIVVVINALRLLAYRDNRR